MPALGEKLIDLKFPEGKRIGEKSEYAYVFETYEYYSPRAIYRLLSHGIRLKVASDPFYHANGKKFERGAILIPVTGQEKNVEQIEFIINEIVRQDAIEVYPLKQDGLSRCKNGKHSFLRWKKPISMIVGDGISATTLGKSGICSTPVIIYPLHCCP